MNRSSPIENEDELYTLFLLIVWLAQFLVVLGKKGYEPIFSFKVDNKSAILVCQLMRNYEKNKFESNFVLIP